jgi:hypothetical protein
VKAPTPASEPPEPPFPPIAPPEPDVPPLPPLPEEPDALGTAASAVVPEASRTVAPPLPSRCAAAERGPPEQAEAHSARHAGTR